MYIYRQNYVCIYVCVCQKKKDNFILKMVVTRWKKKGQISMNSESFSSFIERGSLKKNFCMV